LTKPLILDFAAIDASQNVALAGVLLPVGVAVSLDEAGLRSAGVSQADINATTVAVQLVRAESNAFTTVSTTQLARVTEGVWAGAIPAPTVAAGTTFTGGIIARLSDDIDIIDAAGVAIRLADEDKANARGLPVRFNRAAS